MDASTEQDIATAAETVLFTSLKAKAMTYLIAQIPAIGGWFLNPIVGWIVGLAIQGVITQADEQIYNGFITLKTERQAQAVADDQQKLQQNPTPANQSQLEQDANNLIKLGHV